MDLPLEERAGLWARTGDYTKPLTDQDRYFYIKTQEAVDQGVALLREASRAGCTLQFSELLSFLAHKRNQLSFESTHPRDEIYGRYGKERIDHPTSPIPKNYLLKVKEFTKDFSVKENLYRMTMVGNISQMEIPLTTIYYHVTDSVFLNNIYHTDPKYFNLIKGHCQELFQEALESSDHNQIFKTVAKIHWWMANAMFYEKGSASIADNLTKCIFGFKEIKPKAWKEGISPDIEAFICTEENYVQKYRQLFQ